MLRPCRGDSCFLALPSEPGPERKPGGGSAPQPRRRQQLGLGGSLPMAAGGALLVTPKPVCDSGGGTV